MACKKMTQRRGQLGGVLDIAGSDRRPNIIHQHLADSFRSMLLMQQILPQYRRGNFRHMFMLGDRGDLRLCQSAQADTVFKRDHLKTIGDLAGDALRQIKP